MSDQIDDASEIEERQRTASIESARAIAARETPKSDMCLECGEQTEGGARWCDAMCRDLYQERRAALARNGRP